MTPPLQPMSAEALRREAELALDDVIRARRRLELVTSGLAALDVVEPETCGRIAAVTDQIRSNAGQLGTQAQGLHRRAQREAARGYGYLPIRREAS